MRLHSHVSNPTGLVKIPRKNVEIRVHIAPDGSYDTFDVRKLSLDLLGLNVDAKVWICAEAGDTAENYEIGNVGAITAPSNSSLTRLNSQKPLRFRVLVFEAGNPKLLATCESIQPAMSNDPAEAISILPVRVVPLDVIWRMSLEEDNRPELLISDDDALDAGSRIQADASFVALILPEAISRSLVHLVKFDLSNDDPDHWTNRWARFVRDLGGTYPMDSIDSDNDSQIQEWADEIADRFVRKFKLKTKLTHHLENSNG